VSGISTEFRVITPGRLRKLTESAAAAGLEHILSQRDLAALESSPVNIARVIRKERCGPLRPHYFINVVVQQPDSTLGEPLGIVVDILPADWDALPTVAEFDRELDVIGGALG
jgi:hypothetical protein